MPRITSNNKNSVFKDQTFIHKQHVCLCCSNSKRPSKDFTGFTRDNDNDSQLYQS